MSCVLFTEHLTQDGKKIIEICLNAEKSLNALTLDMINLIQPKLDACKADDSVVAILLDGAGEKAFCAGGDVVSLYKSMTGGGDPAFPEEFFTREYLLDYTIHTYPKPIICWGSGIVMGGGMGLLSGCSHRIGSDNRVVPGCRRHVVLTSHAGSYRSVFRADRKPNECNRCVVSQFG